MLVNVNLISRLVLFPTNRELFLFTIVRQNVIHMKKSEVYSAAYKITLSLRILHRQCSIADLWIVSAVKRFISQQFKKIMTS